ncbi:hypothetical protein GLAREA_07416 [Glarea lozoyensis ATCC 20868]|uniref:Uncharacterized protein n=2 Tax=Glarea lozoyensis TaxID=101852 RepID=S3E1D6_GLAL2|nr:uncharacterized protein GLAREA_07416 [Glarea lozoyensis ATCC 20868]EHK96837.1 hypothetical protein M7I_7462 [Glarea lozoyensis 74030]EPE32283.1 hypothetical protein GLAREA_07416 [Glarea lozoyensis ATCC 20868]
MSDANLLNQAVKVTNTAKVGKSLVNKQPPLRISLELDLIQLYSFPIDGKELEFGDLLYLMKNDNENSRAIVRQHVSHVISPHTPKKPFLERDLRFKAFDTWSVIGGEQVEVECLRGARIKRYDVKVTSPELNFSYQAFDQVRNVYNAVAKNGHTSISDRCFLRVNIISDDTILKFPVMRNLMAILWTFEPHIERAHRELHLIEKYGSAGLRRSKNTSTILGDPLKALEEIMKCNYLSELGKLLRIDDSSAYIFDTRHYGFDCYTYAGSSEDDSSDDGCPDDDDSEKVHAQKADVKKAQLPKLVQAGSQNIVFRQHRGTLDVEEAINWVLLCRGFVNLAQSMDSIILSSLLKAWIIVPERNDVSVLVVIIREVLCLPEVAGYYEDRGNAVVDEQQDTTPIA